MQLYNAMDLLKGKKADYNKLGTLTQPIQFLPSSEKDDEWMRHCMDWIEFQGIKQLRRNAPRLLKNYNLAQGTIDKGDYIVSKDNEFSDVIEKLTEENESALELKFYPIIPNVINVLANEFTKRYEKIMYRAIDDDSTNDMLSQKRQMIEDYLLAQASQKQQMKLIEMGLEPDSEEAQQMMSPETLKTLPEIESFFRNDYRSIYEEWATHQHNVDVERFKLPELEERGFRDMLITDREFWHFKMMEDDYEIELWNPPQVFYNKSPGSRYISQANWVGMSDLMSISDVVDKFGWMMCADDLQMLERIYPARAAGYLVPGLSREAYYDPTKSHAENTEMPSLAYRQFMSHYESSRNNGDIVQMILGASEDLADYNTEWLLRVTTIYWKSQRKLGHLTKITEEGEIIQDIVDETYKVSDKPIYNTAVYKNKTKDNLIFGEHIDWIWINETMGGIKIGPNRPSYWGMNKSGGIDPIYLGLNNSKPGRVPFQFKGDTTLYGCKIPVEGAVFNDRNTRSKSMVDNMKPFQIGHNICMNQIADILIDELGTIIVFDHNTLPQHSMGEDWGKNNLEGAYIAMKNFSMLPLDTSLRNTESALNFQHYQALNLEQTNRLMSRIQLATYFKQEAFAAIGLTPERMGQQIAQQDTAKGIEVSLSASFAQTEQYFTQHCINLMPRVHQMRTELAQYYNSNNPSARLKYLTSEHEKVVFTIDGTKLLMRDLNVFVTTKANHRQIMEQIRQLAINNNTTGGSIFDLGNILKADSIADMTKVLKASEEKINAIRQQEQAHEQEMMNQQLEADKAAEQARLMYDAEQAELDRQKDILVAEIRATSQIGSNNSDMNKDGLNDQINAMKMIQDQQNYTEQANQKREVENNKVNLSREKMSIEREKLATQREIAQKQLEIAQENKTNAELAAKRKAQQSNKKK